MQFTEPGKNDWTSFMRLTLCVFLSFILVACGGGGTISRDSGNTPDPSDPAFEFSLSLSIAQRDTGEFSNNLSVETPLTVSATVTNQEGDTVSDQLVTFTFNIDDLASFSPESGTSLTDDNGVAVIDLIAGTVEGGGLVTARLETGESASIGFNSAGDASSGLNNITMNIISQVTEQPDNNLSANNPLTVTALVEDPNGAPVVDELLTFTFSQDGLAFFDPPSGTALTNTDGIASINLIVGEEAGAAKVLVSTSTGEADEIGFVSAGGGSNVAEQPATLDFFTSAVQIASSGSDEVELIALVKDDQNILMEGIEVSFSADSGELLITQATTGPDGTARARLTSQNNPKNRFINVTAETGSLTESLRIEVVGTEIRINAPTSVTLNDDAPITIVLVDSDGVGIANESVLLESAVGNAIDFTGNRIDEQGRPVTDETGQVTVRYTAITSGTDQFTVTAFDDFQGSAPISVQEDEFTFTSEPDEDIRLRTDQPFTVTWLKNNEPFVGGRVTVTTTRGVLSISEALTDDNGQVSFTASSLTAGSAIISARGIETDENGDENEVNARSEVEFVATTVASIIVAANPNSIGPDGQKSAITAVLRDEIGNLVKDVDVNFTADDVSGGSLFPPVSRTDSNGLATTVYTSNTVTSEDAITIFATESTGGLTAETNITVADRAQFISLGTGNAIESPDDATYLKRFSVFVTDANSNPVNNVALTVTGTPVGAQELLNPNSGNTEIRPAFFKGYWEPFPTLDAFEFWVPVRTIGCPNEDADGDAILDDEDDNNNNVLDPGEDRDGDNILDVEDTNGDGNLTPGNIVSIDGNVVTDENGQAIVELRYPKTFAAWVTIKITVSTPVAGSENRVSQFYTLAASGADVTIETSPPNSNPFGDGQNFVTDPNDPTQVIDDGTARVCTNLL